MGHALGHILAHRVARHQTVLSVRLAEATDCGETRLTTNVAAKIEKANSRNILLIMPTVGTPLNNISIMTTPVPDGAKNEDNGLPRVMHLWRKLDHFWRYAQT